MRSSVILNEYGLNEKCVHACADVMYISAIDAKLKVCASTACMCWWVVSEE